MVCENARRAMRPRRVIVATDDERIAEAVRAFGGEAVMTSAEHRTGTDRIAQVVREHLTDVDAVVNVQGDEPDIRPEQIDLVAQLLEEHDDAAMTTLACRMQGEAAMNDPNQVKVVVDGAGRALYFSRAAIPFTREAAERDWAFLGHIGIYGYRREFLLKYTEIPQTELEKRERLEQLRALESGYVIRVGITDRPIFGIDTPEDLERFRTMLTT
jgi:3-deoxy-manno-octulosonate cytidylyltransferase (CMP-KDO synthetase)